MISRSVPAIFVTAPVAVGDALTFRAHDSYFTVGTLDPVLDRSGLRADDEAAQPAMDLGKVLGMNGLPGIVRQQFARLRVHAADPVHLLGPDRLFRLRIKLPTPDTHHLLGSVEPLLAVAQFRLSGLQGANVDAQSGDAAVRHAAVGHQYPGAIAQSLLDRAFGVRVLAVLLSQPLRRRSGGVGIGALDEAIAKDVLEARCPGTRRSVLAR